jgi:Spy/CpxP family protein refolding chaperone
MMKKYLLWIVLSLAVVFGLGVAGGVFGERYFVHKKSDRPAQQRPHPPSLDAFAKELGLTAEQQDRIREIFKRNDQRMKTLSAEEHKRLGEVRALLKSEIDAVLTPEQKQKFEAMIQRHREEYRRRSEQSGRTPQRKDSKRPEETNKGENG